jgi:hypothetical protein
MSLEALELLFDEIIECGAVSVPFVCGVISNTIEAPSVVDLKSDLILM